MNTEDQHSADENIKLKKKLSFAIDGQKEMKPKKSRTLCNARKDRFGSPIKKGGKHRICFRDKIQGEKNRLCDVVNISLINCNESNLSINDKLVKKNGTNNSNNSLSKNPNVNSMKQDEDPKTNQVSKKALSLTNTGAKEDENCSCACNIF